jgi:hypothetical protein
MMGITPPRRGITHPFSSIFLARGFAAARWVATIGSPHYEIISEKKNLIAFVTDFVRGTAFVTNVIIFSCSEIIQK